MIVANTKVSIHMCTLIYGFDVDDVPLGTWDCRPQEKWDITDHNEVTMSSERKGLPSQLKKIECNLLEVIILPKERIHKTEGALFSKGSQVKLESFWWMLAMSIQGLPKEEAALFT